jgi:hypothetical protein
LTVLGVTAINWNFFNRLATQEGLSMSTPPSTAPAALLSFQAHCSHELFQVE